MRALSMIFISPRAGYKSPYSRHRRSKLLSLVRLVMGLTLAGRLLTQDPCLI